MKKLLIKLPENGVSISVLLSDDKGAILRTIAGRIVKFYNADIGTQIMDNLDKHYNTREFYKDEIDNLFIKPYENLKSSMENLESRETLEEALILYAAEEDKTKEIFAAIRYVEQGLLKHRLFDDLSKSVKVNIKSFIEDKAQEHLEAAEKLIPADLEYKIIDGDLELPEREILREAWKYRDGKVVICPEKQMECIRKKRNIALENLDSLQLKEQFKPKGDVENILKKKQELRDLPKNIENLDAVERINITKLLIKEDL